MKKRKTKTLCIIRILVAILCAFNLIVVFTAKDEARKNRELFNATQSALMLASLFVPNFIERVCKVNVSTTANIIFVAFCFSHFVIGEMCGLFAKSRVFDSILHTVSGAMIAILGCSVMRLLNKSEKAHQKLRPLFVTIFAVSFSVTIGVIWEFIEYTADTITGSNMQRYSNSITRELLLGQNALFDTMKDLFLDFIGSTVMSIIIYIKLKKQMKKENKKLTTKKLIID